MNTMDSEEDDLLVVTAVVTAVIAESSAVQHHFDGLETNSQSITTISMKVRRARDFQHRPGRKNLLTGQYHNT